MVRESEFLVDLPPGDGPFPALILAPGRRYHMGMPIPSQVARRAAERGIAVYRFNWSASSATPSEDLSPEVDDMLAILDRVTRERRVAENSIFVGGKSLGSVVAWKVLAANPQLRGALLFTPLCSHTDGETGASIDVADAHYPGIETEGRPVFFLAGDRDPLCLPAALYRLAARAAGPTRVAVLGGGHDLNDPAPALATRAVAMERRVDLAACLAAEFMVSYA